MLHRMHLESCSRPPGLSRSQRRRVRIAVATALAFVAMAVPATAGGPQVYDGPDPTGGAYTQMQARGAIDERTGKRIIWSAGSLRDSAPDGVCAHVQLEFRHVNGPSYYRGTYVCGFRRSAELRLETRNADKYLWVKLRIWVDRGRPGVIVLWTNPNWT